MKKKDKTQKKPYVDDGHTIYDMSGLQHTGRRPVKNGNVPLSPKEKRAAIFAAYSVYIPVLLLTLLGFGLAMLLIWFWLS